LAHITLYTGGCVKGTIYSDACREYLRRIHLWSIYTKELVYEDFTKLKFNSGQSKVFALHEEGLLLSSIQFCQVITNHVNQGQSIVFLIGAARGLPSQIFQFFHEKISFGPMTWPHLLSRVLLLEQIYRAQQHVLRHPYSFI
jgi:rRNA large subunit m3Psi methyltransferase RlmH